MGRSKGGLSTKIHAICDALGNPTGFHLTGGQTHDLAGADVLLEGIEASASAADRASDADERVRKRLEKDKCSAVIPSKANRKDDKTLRWQGRFGGGHLSLSHKGKGAVGVIGNSENPVSVSAGAKAQFSCAVALDCGATYATAGAKVTGLKWDTSSQEWKSAKWVEDRLLLTFSTMSISRL
ncbi:MAG: transposase [Hormoscilla sp. GUM202]|nr:transposase [Hormoscilla sp. GUM202]